MKNQEKRTIKEGSGSSEKRYFTTAEAAVYTGIPANTLRVWRNQSPPAGPNFFKPMGRVLYDRDELDGFIRSGIVRIPVRAKQGDMRNVAV
jgi:hypothetical protein